MEDNISFSDQITEYHRETNEMYPVVSLNIDIEKYNSLSPVIKGLIPAYTHLVKECSSMLACIEQKKDGVDSPLHNLSFGSALELLRAGVVVTRAGWNGKGLAVFKQVPAHIGSDVIPKMQSLPQLAKYHILRGEGSIDYTNQCLIYNTNTGRADSWVPSSSDMFAMDWEIVY